MIDNDAAFDKWLETFEQKRKKEALATSKSRGKRHISQEEYLAKYARVYGGE